VTAVDAHPIDEKLLISSSLDKSIKIWDMRTKNSTGNIQYHTGAVWTAKFNNNGKIIASGG
jgi:WD40 repeat protein